MDKETEQALQQLDKKMEEAKELLARVEGLTGDPFNIGGIDLEKLDTSSPLNNHLVIAKLNDRGLMRIELITPYGKNEDGYTLFFWETGPSRWMAVFVDSEPSKGQAKVLHDIGPPPGGDKDNYDWEPIDRLLNDYRKKDGKAQ